jgi:hypothetical protein
MRFVAFIPVLSYQIVEAPRQAQKKTHMVSFPALSYQIVSVQHQAVKVRQ